jgi:5-(aminomethyl)-3-furanmethanol phosphate kinase
MPDRWVIKLGGSLYGNPLLHDWLTAIVESGKGRAIVVPGGGPFADAVRDAQKKIGFDEVTAHSMALLAMEKYAAELVAMNSHFTAAKNLTEIETVFASGNIPIWLPTEMTLAADDVPPSWDMTSDSLAAWLAAQISASHLLLVKSCAVPDGELELHVLAQGKIVDPLLPMFAEKGDLAVRMLSAKDSSNLSALLSNDTVHDYL